jgi:hypothetical protein
MGQFKKGQPRAAGAGRRKGVPNRFTADLKAAILTAAQQAGGGEGQEALVRYLRRQADENPPQFMVLLGKVLPHQVGLDPESDGGAITVVIQKFATDDGLISADPSAAIDADYQRLPKP